MSDDDHDARDEPAGDQVHDNDPEHGERSPTETAADDSAPDDSTPDDIAPDDTAPDDTAPNGAPPDDAPDEAFEHPVNRQTMAILLVAVVLVAVAVLAAVLIAKRDDPAPAPSAAPAPSTIPAPAPLPTTTVTASPPSTTEIPAPPYEVAQALGPGELPIYGAAGATEPTRTLPSSIVVGVEQTARVPLVLLVRARPSTGWLEVYLPVRPNGSTGFVRASDVMVFPHSFRIEVSLSGFHLRAFDGDRVILDAPIAVGAGSTPTPGGLYYTNMLLQPPDPTGPYGTYAYGLSGYSDALTEFNGGDGQLGIHGTNQPWLMGQTVSNGCIRLRNEDIDQLAAVLPLGVPVVVQP